MSLRRQPDHHDTKAILTLRQVNRALHDTITPSALQSICVFLRQIHGGKPHDIPNRLGSHMRYSGTPLPSTYQHARYLKVRIIGWFIQIDRYVPEELLPDLWMTLSFLQSLKSVDIAWDHGHDAKETTRARVRTIRFEVADAVMQATGDRLERLVISDGWDFDPSIWISFFPNMTSLKSLRIPPYALKPTSTRGLCDLSTSNSHPHNPIPLPIRNRRRPICSKPPSIGDILADEIVWMWNWEVQLDERMC